MSTSFPFITDNILGSNLDKALNHITDLTSLSESNQYKTEQVLLSSLRKTIIILAASIIEALLLWKLKQIITTKKVELDDEWKYPDLNILYKIDDFTEVISGTRYKDKKDVDDLDFNRIIGKCCKHKIIKSMRLAKKVHKVRGLRNRLHIGNLAEIEKEYTKEDLEFCFNVAIKIEELVSKK